LDDDTLTQLNSAGVTLATFPLNPGQPVSVALDSSENVWVTEGYTEWVVKLNLLAS